MTAGSDAPDEEGAADVDDEQDADDAQAAAGDRQEEPPATERPDVERTEDGEWRYAVDDVSEDDEADEEGNVAGVLMRDEPLEAQAIDPENALFFLVGALGTILFIVLALSGI